MELTEMLEYSEGSKPLNITPCSRRGTLSGIEPAERVTYETRTLPEDQQKKEPCYKVSFRVKDDAGEMVTATKYIAPKIAFGKKESDLYKILRAVKPAFPPKNFDDKTLTKALLESVVAEIPGGKLDLVLTFSANEKDRVYISNFTELVS